MSSTSAISASSPRSSCEPIAGQPAKRAFDLFLRAYEKGLLIRTTADIIALSPPLTLTKAHIDRMFGMLAELLKETA